MLPATATITINDLIPGVQAALQNRSDVSESQTNPAMRPSTFIKRAVQEITESYPFEELRVTGPQVQLTVNQYAYPVSFFLNPGDDYTQLYSFVIFIDFPLNTIMFPMDYMTPKAIRPLLGIPGGFPFKYTRYGTQIFIGPQPGQPYTVFWNYQFRHPFNDASLVSSPLYIPDTWQDIIEYAAAQRAAVGLRWNDQATYLHTLLYGDPQFQISGGKEGQPGLIASRVFQQTRDESMNSRQLMPVVSRVNPR